MIAAGAVMALLGLVVIGHSAGAFVACLGLSVIALVLARRDHGRAGLSVVAVALVLLLAFALSAST